MPSDRKPRLEVIVDYAQLLPNFIRLWLAFRRLRPDVLHVNNGGYPLARSGQIVPLAARAAGVAHVVFFVHSHATAPATATRFERWLDRIVSAATTVFVTPARSATDSLTVRRAVPRSKITTIRLGQRAPHEPTPPARAAIDDELGLPPGTFKLFVVGQLTTGKAQDDAIRALTFIRAAGHDAHLIVIGDGPQRAEFEEFAQQLGAKQHVTFLGFQRDPERLFVACDVLVSASTLEEASPYVIREAMAQARPVVATDTGACRELVDDGHTGWLVRPSDPKAIAEAVIRYIEDPRLRLRHGAAARERLAAEYSMPHMIETLRMLYSDMPPGVA